MRRQVSAADGRTLTGYERKGHLPYGAQMLLGWKGGGGGLQRLASPVAILIAAPGLGCSGARPLDLTSGKER